MTSRSMALEKTLYYQLKKHLKVDPETRSYDFLTKIHEKNRMCRNILISGITLENLIYRKQSLFFLCNSYSSQFLFFNQTLENSMWNRTKRMCSLVLESQQIKRSCPKSQFWCFLPFFQNCHFFVFAIFLPKNGHIAFILAYLVHNL